MKGLQKNPKILLFHIFHSLNYSFFSSYWIHAISDTKSARRRGKNTWISDTSEITSQIFILKTCPIFFSFSLYFFTLLYSIKLKLVGLYHVLIGIIHLLGSLFGYLPQMKLSIIALISTCILYNSCSAYHLVIYLYTKWPLHIPWE